MPKEEEEEEEEEMEQGRVARARGSHIQAHEQGGCRSCTSSTSARMRARTRMCVCVCEGGCIRVHPCV